MLEGKVVVMMEDEAMARVLSVAQVRWEKNIYVSFVANIIIKWKMKWI